MELLGFCLPVAVALIISQHFIYRSAYRTAMLKALDDMSESAETINRALTRMELQRIYPIPEGDFFDGTGTIEFQSNEVYMFRGKSFKPEAFTPYTLEEVEKLCEEYEEE